MNIFDLSARVSLDTSAFEKGLGLIKGGLKGLTASIGVGAAALGKMVSDSVSAYGSYEQLVGGVQTLFGDSAQKVLENSEQAFHTAGMSMNEYMETSIQSAAALINSLGGDQAQAAELMDMSITDMSDNVNKMGTTMEAVQNAYRGFSRQNFTMLDNLALGFAGTKEGMQELLDKAEQISGVRYDISSYSDIVKAIHVVQQEMGITGTTAAEAAGTIQGSVGSMKAAWENLKIEFVKEDGDIGQSIDVMVESALTAFDNIEPKIERALGGVSQFVGLAAPILIDKLPPIIEKIVPSLVTASGSLVIALGKGVIQTIPALAKTGGSLIKRGLKNAGVDLGLFGWVKEDAEKVFGTFNNLVEKINFKGLLDSAKSVIEPLSKYWEKLGDGVSWLSENVISPVIEWGMNDALPKVFEGVAASFDVLRGAIEFLETPAKAIWEEFLQPLGSIAGDVIEGSLDLISKGLNGIADAVEGVDWEGYWFDIFEGKFGEDWALGWDEIKNNIEDAGDSIEEFFDTPDEEGWGKKWRTFWEDAGGAVYDFKSHIDKEIENTTEILGNFFDGVKKAKDDGAGFIDYMGDVLEGRDYKINSTFEWDSGEFWEETYGIDPSKLQKQQVIESRQKKRIEAAKEAGRAEAEAKRIEAAKQAGKAEAGVGGMVGSVLNALSGFRKMARGGVIVGEAGAEAVVPLENNTQWTSKVADEVVDRVAERVKGGSGMVVQNLTINMQGMEISSDYGTQRFIEKLSEQLKVYQNTQIRGVGGVGY